MSADRSALEARTDDLHAVIDAVGKDLSGVAQSIERAGPDARSFLTIQLAVYGSRDDLSGRANTGLAIDSPRSHSS